MKYQFILLLLVSTFTSQAQPYEQLLEEGRTWNLSIQICDVSGGLKVDLAGDTIVNNLSYQKVFYELCGDRIYWGLTRANDQNSRLWFWPADESSEGLIMDLDLEVGDIFTAPYEHPNGGNQATVERVLNIDDRKVIELDWIHTVCSSNPLKIRFHEGLGPNSSFDLYNGLFNSGITMILNCCYQEDSLLYKEPFLDWYDCDNDCIRTSTTELGRDISQFRVYPNPAQGHFFIETPRTGGHYELVDIKGHKIRRGILDRSATEVDLMGLPDGVYFVFIYSNRQRQAIKKVIIH